MIWISRGRLRQSSGYVRIGWSNRDIGGTIHLFVIDVREYTVSLDGIVSWRVEVALRAVLLSTDEETLQRFLAGQYDGTREQGQVNDILRKILVEKVELCETVLALSWTSCIEKDLVRKLWERELNIARATLEIL